MRKIGITTTVPVEVIYSSGAIPVDINNLFITSKDYGEYIELAEREGFPKSMCAWIKGLYGACIKHNIKEIVGVVAGDCSNTASLTEVLKSKGIKVIPFSYPHNKNIEDIKIAIDRLMMEFGVDLLEVEKVRERLNFIREKIIEFDKLNYIENKCGGFLNHLWQVSASDFNGDYIKFEKEIEKKIEEIKKSEKKSYKMRLGYIGVPPMTGDLYEFMEDLGAKVVYNEVQREFAFPRYEKDKTIYEQYINYTYPYSIGDRLVEIKKQIEAREIDAIIHYTQAFCHKAIEDILVKKEIDIPILNIEGDKLNVLDARTKLRIEAFLDMLGDRVL